MLVSILLIIVQETLMMNVYTLHADFCPAFIGIHFSKLYTRVRTDLIHPRQCSTNKLHTLTRVYYTSCLAMDTQSEFSVDW